jgi:hypothetical protein
MNASRIPGIHEHLTVELWANFRDWSIRYHSRSRTSTDRGNWFRLSDHSRWKTSLMSEAAPGANYNRHLSIIQKCDFHNPLELSIICFFWSASSLEKFSRRPVLYR